MTSKGMTPEVMKTTRDKRKLSLGKVSSWKSKQGRIKKPREGQPYEEF